MADTPTPHYGFILQQPGTNRNVWGGKLNQNWSSIDGILFAASTDASVARGLAEGALLRTGGTMTGDQILSSAGPTDARSAGYRGTPVSSFNADKTLVLADAGVTQRLIGSTTRTLTIPSSGSVGFPAGTVIPIRVSSSASLVIARAAGVQLRLAGSATNANRTVSSQGLATLLYEDTNAWVISGIGVS